MRWIIVWVWCSVLWAIPGMLIAAESIRPTIIGVSTQGHSIFPPASDFHPDPIVRLNLRLSTGLRRDGLIWSTAGTLKGNRPNILSELSWTNIYSQQWLLDGYGTIGSKIYGRAAMGYAQIDSGQVTDSDYDGDNRTFEYSRSLSQTNGDQMWDGSVGGGPSFFPGHGNFQVVPMLGFAIREQNLRITDGWQVLSSPPRTPAAGPLDMRLNSTYQSQWSGPWLGLDLRTRMSERTGQAAMEFILNLEYHFMLDFSATADWNLRGDLQHPVSFGHDAEGDGVLLRGEWLVHVHRRLAFSISLCYLRFAAEQGTSLLHSNSGTVRQTLLNGVVWESTSMLFGAVYSF